MKYKKWVTDEAKGALVLIHGMGAGTDRWEDLARHFLTRGISSYALSLRGFDGTEGEKGYIDSFDTYHKDIRELYSLVREDIPSGKIFLLGESMGGLITFEHAARFKDLFDGYVLISPAFGSKLKFAPHTYLLILMSMLFFPKKQFKMPFNTSMCTKDSDQADKIDRNPAEHRYASGSLLREIFLRQVKASGIASKISSPIIFLISAEDEIADPQKSIKVFEKTRRAQKKKLIEYPGMKHALSIEEGRENVFEDIYKWGWGSEIDVLPEGER